MTNYTNCTPACGHALPLPAEVDDAPNDDIHDPIHHRDHAAPCSWCGARWVTEGDHEVMDHHTACGFILATS